VNTLAFALGTPLVLLGALLHLWSQGCLSPPNELATGGPYRFIRHPFYLANALLDIGICIIAHNWLIYAVYPALFVVTCAWTIIRDEKYMAQRHGEAWQIYRKRVPMIIPSRWPAPSPPGSGFRWKNLAREGELSRSIRLFAYPLLFHLWGQIMERGTIYWRRLETADILEILLLFGWYASSVIVHWVIEKPAQRQAPS
jgi:hypothetical protein